MILSGLLTVALWGCTPAGQYRTGGAVPHGTTAGVEALGSTDEELARLFETQQHNVFITGAGTVERILSDDTKGIQHQRFILRLASGQTLLVTHNIDIAPRVEPLAVGDIVFFAGIYEYNDEGGVIHWTHHDPQGKHRSGYLRVGGLEFS
ncbi:MAG: DUF3465 domain-containing protein [Coriobacteriia bacterium]|nr:DUF3465 domain-containing protein [Coriobacteriia bacterium]